jgi:DNA invertase Pin-like site-specific DNA recombinase
VLVGYGRVSTRDQNLARQEAALTEAGCAKCFFDKASGKNADRPGLKQAYEYLRPGDALTVVSLDRLGRSLEDLIGIVGQLKRMNVGFQSLHEKLDTTTPRGMFIFHVFAALAEFIRTIIVANTNEGLAAARARGQQLGRPPAMTPEKVAYALQLLAEPDRSLSAIAKPRRTTSCSPKIAVSVNRRTNLPQPRAWWIGSSGPQPELPTGGGC